MLDCSKEARLVAIKCREMKEKSRKDFSKDVKNQLIEWNPKEMPANSRIKLSI